MNAYLKQNTTEWLEWRKDKIGASDAPIVMGVSPFKTPLQLWMLKTGEMEEEPDTPWMKRGRDLEKEALKAFEKEVGICMFDRVLTHKSRSWQVASFDGITLDEDNAVEIKCPGAKDHQTARQWKIPEKYYPQLQHQMCVADLPFIYYYSYDGVSGILLKVERDDKYIKKLVKKEEEFYKLMIDGVRPDLTDRDYCQRQDDLDWLDAEEKWKRDYEELQKAKKYEATSRKDLINLSKGKSSIGKYVKATKFMQTGRIDYGAIPVLLDLNLDKYRGEDKERWRLSLYK